MKRGAIILCGGKSTRLGLPISKCLLPLGNTTLVQEQIKAARDLGATKIFLSSNEDNILQLAKMANANKDVAIYLNSAQNFMEGLLQVEQFFGPEDEVLVMMGDNSYPQAAQEFGNPSNSMFSALGYLKAKDLDLIFTYSKVSSSDSNGPRLYRKDKDEKWRPVWGHTKEGEIYQGFVLATTSIFDVIKKTAPSRRGIIEIVDVIYNYIVFYQPYLSFELPGHFNEITTVLDYVRLRNIYTSGESSEIYTSGAGMIVYRYAGEVAPYYVEVLILRRSDNNLWGIPGGVIDVEEQPIDAARREATEETGLTLGDLQPIGFYQIKNKAGDPAIIALYSAEAKGTEKMILGLDSESSAYSWITEEGIGERVFANQNDFLIREFFKAKKKAQEKASDTE